MMAAPPSQAKTVQPKTFHIAEMVPVDQIHPNTYNPNLMPDTLFQEIMNDIRHNGFLGAIIARPRPEGGYEIIDGEHRWRAAKQLGFTEIPVIPHVSDGDDAKTLTVRLNHERGYFDTEKMGALIRDLNQRHSLDDLVKRLGMAREEMVQYLRIGDIPKKWVQDMKIGLEDKQAPQDKEPLIFFFEADRKAQIQTLLTQHASKHSLPNRNEALWHLCKNSKNGQDPLTRKALEYYSRNHPEYRQAISLLLPEVAKKRPRRKVKPKTGTK